jgi:ubiquinone/menaquinone biosynthesis C-methylase UbiE
MRDEAKRAVQSQFGRQASQYAASKVHGRPSSGLDALLRLASPRRTDRALDVAAGTGFTALALALRCREVIGVDFTASMIREACAIRDKRGISNLRFCLGDAEALPFRDSSFDVVACRQASHHFPHLPVALREMARVARPGGRVVLDDSCAPEDPDLEALMNDWESRRDPSHVADHPPSRLKALVEQSGLRIEDAVMTSIPLEFSDWVKRSGMPGPEAAALRRRFLSTTPAAASAFRIARRGSEVHFTWPEVVILGMKP